MKKSERKAIIEKTVQKAGENPCAICAETADAVMAFTPENLEAFGMTDDQAIYTPLCLKCMNEGPDLEFLEKTLLHCGVKQTLE